MSDKEVARIKKLFGANIKKIRESKDLSLLEADYVSELNESNISKYEKNFGDIRENSEGVPFPMNFGGPIGEA